MNITDKYLILMRKLALTYISIVIIAILLIVGFIILGTAIGSIF